MSDFTRGEATGNTGGTHGSPERPARRLQGEALHFNLHTEIAQLHREHSWSATGRAAVTLVKEPSLTIVLMTLQSGITIHRHRAAGELAVYVLHGRVRMRVGDVERELTGGELLTIEPEVDHDVHAVQDSALLLTIGGSKLESGQ
ncbi:MAG: cupin domain-containing protein [Chloroflexi bacterium]|nr:cupin domain-containing protein [Chloroflexota bacterium]